jgi:hypothetical protein
MLAWEILRFRRIKAELINGALFEAVRRVVPDLLRLNRYERRAAAPRDRAIALSCKARSR